MTASPESETTESETTERNPGRDGMPGFSSQDQSGPDVVSVRADRSSSAIRRAFL